MILIIIFSLILTLSDQIIKILIDNKLNLNESIDIIPNFFDITKAYNNGAAWSILSNKQFLLIGIGIAALVIIYIYFIRNKALKRIDIIALSMLIAGIVGNLIDRIRLGYVIDYLDFTIFNYDYPVFNLADTLIVVSMIILILKSIKEEKDAKNISK